MIFVFSLCKETEEARIGEVRAREVMRAEEAKEEEMDDDKVRKEYARAAEASWLVWEEDWEARKVTDVEKKKRKRERVCIVCHTYILLAYILSDRFGCIYNFLLVFASCYKLCRCHLPSTNVSCVARRGHWA